MKNIYNCDIWMLRLGGIRFVKMRWKHFSIQTRRPKKKISCIFHFIFTSTYPSEIFIREPYGLAIYLADVIRNSNICQILLLYIITKYRPPWVFSRLSLRAKEKKNPVFRAVESTQKGVELQYKNEQDRRSVGKTTSI